MQISVYIKAVPSQRYLGALSGNATRSLISRNLFQYQFAEYYKKIILSKLIYFLSFSFLCRRPDQGTCEQKNSQ